MHCPILTRAAVLISIAGTVQAQAATPSFPGDTSEWYGYTRYDFTVAGKACIVVAPQQAAPGRPWIWRARFWGHEPQTDVALLGRGFHVATIDVAGLFGNPQAVALWDRFYTELTHQYGLSLKPALEGMSRGGLIILNWAAAHPERVSCIYADAPLCDIKSWPRREADDATWRECLKAYGMTAEEAITFKGSPVDNLAPIAACDVPLLHVCGEVDEVVPVAGNTAVVEQRYKALGGRIQTILKPGVGHHPHSLADPQPIVDFVLEHTENPATRRCFRARGLLQNCRQRFELERRGRVAFLGGSITHMDGYRPRVARLLQQRFPDTDFAFLDAGVSSTCSLTAAFRLENEVLSQEPIDLLFVEFSVNDQQDAHHPPALSTRAMEGIVRHALTSNPAMDIVLLYTLNEHQLGQILAGEEPREMAAHRRVAEHYHLADVDLAADIAARIRAEELDWGQFGGCHPSPLGNDLYAGSINGLFERCWRIQSLPVPFFPQALDPYCYAQGRFISPADMTLGAGWSYGIPDWEALEGSLRSEFANRPMLCANEPGSQLDLDTPGTALALYVLAGPDAGTVEVTVDGQVARCVDLYHGFSAALHYPRTVLLADELPPGNHHVTLRVAPEKAPESKGHALRILGIGVN